MSQPALRPWLASTARCTPRHASTSKVVVRHQSTQPTRRLDSARDWAAFKRERAESSSLLKFFEQYGSTTESENTWKIRDGLRKPAASSSVSALLASGAHFGHASTRMNPNFVPYAYGTRAGVTIIDLDHTLPMLRRTTNLVRSVARAGGSILFVGTRPDLKPIVERAAQRLDGQGFYVGDRWLPGTLTNRRQFFGDDVVDSTRMIPDLVILLNPLQNLIAINECALEHVPTVGIIDSNADPRIVMYPIPANDESTRTAELIAGVLSVAGREGVALGKRDKAGDAKRKDKQDRQYHRAIQNPEQQHDD